MIRRSIVYRFRGLFFQLIVYRVYLIVRHLQEINSTDFIKNYSYLRWMTLNQGNFYYDLVLNAFTPVAAFLRKPRS